MTNRLSRDERADVRWWARYGMKCLLALVVLVFLLGAVGLVYGRYIGRAQRNIDAGNRRAGYENQATQRELLSRKISDYEAATTDAHRHALKDEICGIADNVRGGFTLNQSAFVGSHC